MRSWRMIAVALALFSIPTPAAHSQPVEPSLARAVLTARIETLIAQRAQLLTGSRIGIAIRDMATGDVVYERNGNELLNIASNVKLVTTAASLALLGPDFTFHTSVYAVPPDVTGTIRGDVYLRGRADPTLGIGDLRGLAREMWLSGVRSIRGGIVIDDTYFDRVDSPPHFEEKPDAAAYRSPIGAAAVGFNMYTLVISAPLSGIGPAVVNIDPPNTYIKVESTVETITQGRSRIRLTSKLRKHFLELKVMGQLRVEEAEKKYKRRIPSSVLFAGSLFRRALSQGGITVGLEKVVTGKVPTRATLLASHTSLPLGELVRGMGKYSNNFVAEMILKTIGAQTRENTKVPATWDDGLRAVRAYLVDQVGLSPDSFTYNNGSGLFQSNRFTANQILRLLSVAYDDFRYGPDFVASLAIAGADGTLRSRMGTSRADRQVRAKTGSLLGVSALSGYAATNSRAPLAFSILINGFPDDASDAARSLQDDISEAMLGYLESVR